jgi:hypothetical protein
MAIVPELESEHTGFAQLFLGEHTALLRLHARVGGRWRVSSLEVPVDRAAKGSLREVPPIQPCTDCDPIDGAADGPVFVPRSPRPD